MEWRELGDNLMLSEKLVFLLHRLFSHVDRFASVHLPDALNLFKSYPFLVYSYTWNQSENEAEIFMEVVPNTNGREIFVRVDGKRLSLGFVGKPPVLEGDVPFAVSDMTWILDRAQQKVYVHITLHKQEPNWWLSIVNTPIRGILEPCSTPLTGDMAYVLGQLCALRENSNSALHYYHRAADDFRHGEAARTLASFYLNGSRSYSIAIDINKYVYYLRIAAEAGVASAAIELGSHFSQGRYVEKSFEEAERYFTIAARCDPKVGNYELAQFHLSFHPNQPNLQAAEEYWLKSASQDYAPAYFQLGLLHLNNDRQQAYKHFRSARMLDPSLDGKLKQLGIDLDNDLLNPQSATKSKSASQTGSSWKRWANFSFGLLGISAVFGTGYLLWQRSQTRSRSASESSS